METEKGITSSAFDKIVFVASITTALFLLFIYLNHEIFRLNFVLIGVVQQMFTIPSFLSQPILLIIAIRGFYISKFDLKTYSFLSLIITAITLIMIGSSIIFR